MARPCHGDAYRQEVEWLLGSLGYRLVLRRFSHPELVSAGGTLPVVMSWENVGVAPPYHAFELVLRLTPSGGSGSPIELPFSADVRTWATGTFNVTESLALPNEAVAGSYDLAIGLHGTPGIPMVNLAIEGRDADGYYPVSSVELQ